MKWQSITLTIMAMWAELLLAGYTILSILVAVPMLAAAAPAAFSQKPAMQRGVAEMQAGYVFGPYREEVLWFWEYDQDTNAVSRLPGQTAKQVGKITRADHLDTTLDGVSANAWGKARILVLICGFLGLALLIICLIAKQNITSPLVQVGLIGGFALTPLIMATAILSYGLRLRVRSEAAHGYATFESEAALRYWLLDPRTGAVLREPGEDKLTRAQYRERRKQARANTTTPPTQTP